MGSIFINAGLAAGVALAAVPVLLHLFMKQTPKHVIFPALRLIKERQKRSRKKLRVKNWLLLLARMGLFALMALALARPRIDATAALGTGDEPAAMALVFDTSLSMGYVERENSRLVEAKARAQDVLRKVNDQSKIFVIDSADPGPPTASTPAAARKKIEALTIRPVNRTLNGAMGAAYTAVAAIDLSRREVYVFTDLAVSQWQTGQEVEGLAQARKSLKNGVINTFVLRVSAKEVTDVAIISAEPSAPIVTEDDPLILKVKVRNVGPKAKRTVELRLANEPAPMDKKPIEVPANSEMDVPPLVTPKLKVGLYQFEVRIKGEDPLEFDDVHYLTLEVQPAIKLLVVADRDIDSLFVASALDPQPLAEGAPRPSEGLPRPFQVKRIRTPRLASEPLKGYAAVFLLNVESLDDAVWRQIYTYVVREGGGLVVAPAGRANPQNYNHELADELLPANLDKIRIHKEPLTFGKPDLGSPLFARDQKELIAELGRIPIMKSWAVTPEKKVRVLLSYTDETPALLEKTFAGPKPGKVLLWTTALSRRADFRDSEAWNEFPNPEHWGFVVMLLQTAYYLAGSASQKLTFESGEDAILALDPTRQFSGYAVRGPTTKANGETIGPGMLLVGSPGEIGQWTVEAQSKIGPPQKIGFSINPPRSEMQTTLLDKADLDTLFGKGKYQLAEDANALTIAVGQKRFGREIFPWIMALILLLVTLENLLANTFYREKTTATPRVA
jgi:hypothetical protein